MANNRYLFIYGTLLETGNYYADYLQRNSEDIGPGMVSGRLYLVGEYPGAVPDEAVEARISGKVLLVNDDPVTWKTIDDYEGFVEGAPANEFTRVIVPVIMNGSRLDCWFYRYDFPVERLEEIVSGDYTGFKKGASDLNIP